MRVILEQLVKLASIDAQTRDADEEAKAIPQQIQELREQIERLEQLLAHEQQRINDLAALLNEQEELLNQSADNITRARAKGAQSTNHKEIEAAQREIEANRRLSKEREGEVLRLQETVEQAQANIAKHEEALSEVRESIAEETRQAEQRLGELEAQKSGSVAERQAVSEAIPKDALRHYERIRSRRTPALVWLDEQACGGCRMVLPHQLANQIHRGEAITTCPQCLRIVLYKPLFVPEEDTPGIAAEDIAAQS